MIRSACGELKVTHRFSRHLRSTCPRLYPDMPVKGRHAAPPPSYPHLSSSVSPHSFSLLLPHHPPPPPSPALPPLPLGWTFRPPAAILVFLSSRSRMVSIFPKIVKYFKFFSSDEQFSHKEDLPTCLFIFPFFEIKLMCFLFFLKHFFLFFVARC